MENLDRTDKASISIEQTPDCLNATAIKDEVDSDSAMQEHAEYLDVSTNVNLQHTEEKCYRVYKNSRSVGDDVNESVVQGLEESFGNLAAATVKEEPIDDVMTHEYDENFELMDANLIKEELVDEITIEEHDCLKDGSLTSMTQDESNDIVISLRERNFESRSFTEKLELVQRGRPMPPLRDLKKESRGFVRNFNTDLYEKTKWLCGSAELNKLFCWPCLLFSKPKTVWNSVNGGYSDLNNLHTAIGRHEKSDAHITAWISYKSFGHTRIDVEMEEQRGQNVSKHNDQVKKNRAILRRLIAVMCYLGQQEIAFREHSNNILSSNHDNYVELVHMLAEYDEKLSVHLEQPTVFTDLSQHVQDTIVRAIHDVMISEIKKEIKETKFVAILVDEISTIMDCSQIATVFRYVRNEAVVERFVGLCDIGDRSVASVLHLLMTQIEEFQCGDKVVALTFDGAFTSGTLSGMQVQMKQKIPDAIFVHYYAHKLNKILAQAVSSISECKVFFAAIDGLESFFLDSPKRCDLLKAVSLKRNKVAAGWNFNVNIIETVWKQKQNLAGFFEHILNHPEDWDNETISEAKGYVSILPDFEFNFLLDIFHSIFTQMEIFDQHLQSKQMDIEFCFLEAEQLLKNLQRKQNDFEGIWLSVGEEFEPIKKRLHENDYSLKEHYRKLYSEILNIISFQVQARFTSQNSLLFLELLDSSKYKKFISAFPEKALIHLKEAYGKYFDLARLRSELSVMYSSPVFESKNISELQMILEDNGLHHGLPELSKLCCLLLTIPISACAADPALDRITVHGRNSKRQTHSSGLTLMSIEKKLLREVRAKCSFYDDVIEEFKTKNCQFELAYK